MLPWEILKKQASGTLSTTVPYVSLPSDFIMLSANHNYTENTEYAGRPVIFVGANYQPYYVVSWSDRRQYRSQNNVAYVDIAAMRLYFTVQPTVADTYEFDYCAMPVDLLTSTAPVFPTDFWYSIIYGMSTDDFIVQLFDKARSYAAENDAKFNGVIADMKYWNSGLIQM